MREGVLGGEWQMVAGSILQMGRMAGRTTVRSSPDYHGMGRGVEVGLGKRGTVGRSGGLAPSWHVTCLGATRAAPS